MLYFIGLGLSDEKDITVKGLEAIKKCDFIYLETYTSKLSVDVKKLEEFYGKNIILADRTFVEVKADQLLEKADSNNIAFLVIGDPMAATTHVDLMLRAKEKNIPVKIIHNASILTAIGITGLQLYKFGKTTSIPFENQDVKAPYEVLKSNQKSKLHTLFLLDLKPEQNLFLSINDAIKYLLRIESEEKDKVFKEDTLCVACARIGSPNQVIKSGTASELLEHDFKQGPHCLIVPSDMHFMEEDALKLWK